LYDRQAGRCALTGIPFVFERPPEGCKNHPFSLSLDRIDSRRGYLRDNVRFVLTSMNLALSEWGESVFRRIAEAYLASV
jgi:hypothetical protein